MSGGTHKCSASNAINENDHEDPMSALVAMAVLAGIAAPARAAARNSELSTDPYAAQRQQQVWTRAANMRAIRAGHVRLLLPAVADEPIRDGPPGNWRLACVLPVHATPKPLGMVRRRVGDGVDGLQLRLFLKHLREHLAEGSIGGRPSHPVLMGGSQLSTIRQHRRPRRRPDLFSGKAWDC